MAMEGTHDYNHIPMQVTDYHRVTDSSVAIAVPPLCQLWTRLII